MGIYRIWARTRARTGLRGYQIAGPSFIQQTTKPTTEFLKGVLTGWFRWPKDQADRLITELKREGKLEEEALRRKGVSLKSPDGSEEYLFVQNLEGSWAVTRVRPDEPILKN